MEENEMEIIGIPKHSILHGQIAEQDDEEIKQNKHQNETEPHYQTNYCKNKQQTKNNNEIEAENFLIASNTFQMRRKLLAMDLDTIKTFFNKQLTENDEVTLKKIYILEANLGTICAALDRNNFVKAENSLLTAENLSTELMKKIKNVVNKKAVQTKEVQYSVEDIEVPDYRSIVTVRGTKEDVANCILKAKTALENCKYDRAESLLLKAERIFPTKNARDLLKQVRVAKEPKQNPESIEQAIEAAGQVSSVNEEESKSEAVSINVFKCLTAFEMAFTAGNLEKAERMLNKAKRFDPSLDMDEKISLVRTAIANKIKEPKQNPDSIEEQFSSVNKEESQSDADSTNVVKCLTAFEKAFTAGNLEKAERMLNKVKRIDPSLDMEEKLSRVRTATDKKLMEERRKEAIEKAKRECQKVAKCLYMSMKAYDAGDLVSAEQILLEAKKIDPTLNLESELLKIRSEIASEHNADIKDVFNIGREENITENDIESAAEYLYKAKKAFDAGNFLENEKNLNYAKSFDPSLNLESYLSQCRAKTASLSSTEGKMLNETKRVSQLTNSYYPSRKVNEKPEYIEKHRVKKKPKPSHEITTSEIQFSCLEDEEQTEIDMRIKRQQNKEIEKEMSKVRKVDEKNKDNTDKLVKNDADGDKDGKKKTSNTIELDGEDKCAKKTRPHNSFNYKAKREQAEILITMAEKEINDAKFDNAMDFLNTAEELYPTTRAKELLKNIGKILSSRKESSELLNCYEFPVEINESNEANALKCVEMAQYAFKGGEYDRAEHFLLKSLRICDSETTKSFLKTVRIAKAQNNTKVTVKTEQINNEHINDHSLNEKMNEYKKCIDLATNAMAVGNLPKAERFLSKSIRINPNNDAKKQLHRVQDVRASHRSSDEVSTDNTPKCDDDSKPEREAEMFINLAVDAMSSYKFYVARQYLKWALEKQSNEETWKLLLDVNKEIDIRKIRHPPSKINFKCEAIRLLDKADNCIYIGELEKAESFLINSWNMDTSRRSTLVYKKLIKARLALKGVKNRFGKGKNMNFTNVFQSDRLVDKALDKYHNNELKEAKELLTTASELYPSLLIDKFMAQIGKAENPNGFFQKIYNNTVKKLF